MQGPTGPAPEGGGHRPTIQATACSAVLAVTAALQFDRAPPPAAPVLADDAGDIPDDTLLFEQSPELYLWLGSDALAME